MKVDTLKPKSGSVKRPKRVGRGAGSGHGKTSTKGHKGQKSRAGSGKGPAFEGGQTPMQRRLPKRGFKNFAFKKVYAVINLSDIDSLITKKFTDVDAITPEFLLKHGVIKKQLDGIKVLGDGELSKPINIKAHAFSSSAVQKIQKIGGKAEKL